MGMANLLRDRLKLLVDRASQDGRTARAISMDATGKPDTVRDILSGKIENPRIDTVIELARALKTDLSFLAGGSTVKEIESGSPDGLVPARVVGSVQAGPFLEMDDLSHVEADEPHWVPTVKDSEFPRLSPIAFLIRGDSIDQVCPPGGYAICVPFAETGLPIQDGMWVVADRQRAGLVERTIKMVKEVRPGRFELHPRSNNAKHRPIRFPSLPSEGEEVTIFALVRRFMGPTLQWTPR